MKTSNHQMSGQSLTLPNSVLLPEIGQILKEGKQVVLKVKGNSMLPFIHGDRDSVLLAPCSRENMVHGRVLLVKTLQGNFVLHRVVSQNLSADGLLTLMGDGNLVGKEQCRADDVLGMALKVIRPNGTERELYTPTDKLMVALWSTLLPLRRYLLAIYRRTFSRTCS